jgi:hypothetical protein
MSEGVTMKPPTPEAKAAARTPLPASRKLQLALDIVGTYVRVRWWLWRKDFPATVAAVRATAAPELRADGDDVVAGVRLGRVVRRTLGVLPFDSRCLVRSLVLTSLLARRGIDAKLVIAVEPEPEFAAHAWVECAGIALLPPGEFRDGRLAEF